MINHEIRRNIKAVKNMLRHAFLEGVKSVQPQTLIEKYFLRKCDTLVINGNNYPLNHNVFLVGFGKAVLGMVPHIEATLRTVDNKNHLQSGVVSVPDGIQKTYLGRQNLAPDSNSVVEILEGAKFNIPDETAFMSSKKIVSLIQTLTENDLLIVLISGGGSALLPYPIPPLTIQEKGKLIQCLAKAGANIVELNTVRKALSATKGGKLAQLSKAKIVTFILSDVVGNPLDIIASGPTVLNSDHPLAATNILMKYKLSIAENVLTVLKNHQMTTQTKDFSHVENIIIGSNETALQSVHSLMKKEFNSLILSSSLQGDASQVGRKLAELATYIIQIITNRVKNNNTNLELLLHDLYVTIDKRLELVEMLKTSANLHIPLCLIFGGETTVLVTGSGKGGRNQHLVLEVSLALEELLQETKCYFKGDIGFLSCGTDGIDGPTGAAGAITYWSNSEEGFTSQVQDAHQQKLCPETYKAANDSYNYFKLLNNGQDHVVTGHTGTNVMDVKILCIHPKF